MVRTLLIATLLVIPPAHADAPPEGTAPAPRRQWDYRTDAEIRAARRLALAPT